jgi:hypothetical protein
MTGYQSKKLTAQSREGDLVKRLRAEDPECGLRHSIAMEAADYIENMEKGFRDILTLDDPMLMQMISKACLTGAIDADGKYCFVPPFALGEKKDD